MIYNAGNRSEMQTRQANIFCIIHVILGDRYSPEFLKLPALVTLIAKHPTSLVQLEAVGIEENLSLHLNLHIAVMMNCLIQTNLEFIQPNCLI